MNRFAIVIYAAEPLFGDQEVYRAVIESPSRNSAVLEGCRIWREVLHRRNSEPHWVKVDEEETR